MNPLTKRAELWLKQMSSKYDWFDDLYENNKFDPDTIIIVNDLFLGAGENSILNIEILHYILDKALSDLSGEQQNGLMGSEYSEIESNDAKRDIDKAIENIIIALGAKSRWKNIHS